LGEIMKATGLTHGPFYNHFDSKEALMRESFEHHGQQSLAGIDGHCTTPEGMSAYVDYYLSAQHRDAPGEGCLMPALAAEAAREQGLRPSFAQLVNATVQRFAKYVPWQSKRTARGDSIRLLASMVGAVVLARAVADDSLSNEILLEARKGLQAEVGLSNGHLPLTAVKGKKAQASRGH
jgi:TetR/AcrR family transcriptional repressor of nem operon